MSVPKPKANTRVVHLNKEKYDVYIGRPSIFGNRFRVWTEDWRERAINMFKEEFLQRVEIDPHFYLAVMELEGKILGCWCKPLPCHGDVIAEFIDNEARKERQARREGMISNEGLT